MFDSVDSITKSLNTMIVKLDKVEQLKKDAVSAIDKKIEDLQIDAALASNEATRARNISDRLRALVC